MTDHLRSIETTMRSLRVTPDALGAEVYASQLVSTFVDGGGGFDAVVMRNFLDALVSRKSSESLALLEVLGAVTPDAECRTIAVAYARRLAESGVVEPRWHTSLHSVEFEQAYEFADVYGDQRVVVCVYRGAVVHALVGFVNTSHLGGHLEDLVLTTSVGKSLDGFGSRAARSDGVMTFGLLAEQDAHETLAAALANSYRTIGVDEEVLGMRALLGARLARRPASIGPAVQIDGCTTRLPPAQLDDADSVLGRFRASAERARSGLRFDDPTVRDVLHAIVEFGIEYDSGRITRISPTKLRAMTARLAQDRVVSGLATAAPIIRAWTDWIATGTAGSKTRTALPPAAMRALDAVLDELLPAEPTPRISLDLGLGDELDDLLGCTRAE